MEITFRPIGVAKNGEGKHFGNWKDVVTEIVIDQEWAEALSGLDGYSHVVVIYWLHEIQACEVLHVPQGKVGEVPEVGIFACRCPQRPNPIGISTVELLSVQDNTVTVKGLDVISDTPILDIKPYTPQYDFVAAARVPDWVNKLEY